MNARTVPTFFISAAVLFFWVKHSQCATFIIQDGDVAALRSAVNTSNANGQDDTIELAALGNYVFTDIDNYFNGDNGLPRIGRDGGKKLTVHGNGATLRRRNGKDDFVFRIFYVGSGANVEISAVTISDGLGDDAGGGALYNDNAIVTMNGSTLIGNSTYVSGGGIVNDGAVTSATLTLNNCIMTGNSAPQGPGGAIASTGSDGNATLIVNNCTFTSNVGSAGGAIVSDALFSGVSTTNVNNSSFSGNTANFGRGGGIHNNTTVGGNAVTTVTNCQLTNNSAYFLGGGIGNSAGTLRVRNCILSNNSAGSAGAVYSEYDGANVELTNCTIENNSVGAFGGGFYIKQNATATVTNCTFFGNFAGNNGGSFGGGAIFKEGANLQILNTTFAGNSAGSSGGTIYNYYNGNLIIGNCVLKAGASDVNIINQGTVTTSQGHNVCSDDGAGSLTAAGDQINTDPLLDPAGLQNNGGPTSTVALLTNSPAINAGDDANAPHRDQRGYFRNGQGDIGAFEYQGGLVGTSSVARQGNNIIVSVEVVQGKTYRLERKLSLIDANWQSIPGVLDLLATGNDTESIADPNALNLGKAFYRVRLLP